jgi:hypothetical protein
MISPPTPVEYPERPDDAAREWKANLPDSSRRASEAREAEQGHRVADLLLEYRHLRIS